MLQGIAPADVRVKADGNDAILEIAPTAADPTSGGRIVLRESLVPNAQRGVESIVFDDGTIWTMADLVTLTVTSQQTPGDDYINGLASNDTITGGLGNDTILGGDGNDTYVFRYGDGRDVYNDTPANSATSTNDVLRITGYKANEVLFSRRASDSNDVVDTFKNSDDGILLEHEFDTSFGTQGVNGIETILLTDDGTTFSIDQIRTRVMALAATSGDDVIFGTNGGAETISGGAGNDLIVAGSSAETYLYARGDGDDRIIAASTLNANPYVLKLVDYNASDIASVSRAHAGSEDLVIAFKTGGDRITVTTELGAPFWWWQLDFKVRFADGIEWSRDQLRQQVLATEDTSGNDVVDGRFDDGLTRAGATFTANAGNDTMIGGGYADTFTFPEGHGNDVIDESFASAPGGNTVVFLDIKSTDVTAARSYKGSGTIVLSYVGNTSDSLTILNALATDARGIDSYRFADGVTWDKAKLRSVLDNALPVATDDGYFSATSGQALTLTGSTLTANDYDPNGDHIAIVSVDGGANGTASLDAHGNVVFTPDAAFTGATTLTYTISDGAGGFATATVNVRVRPPASALDDTGFTVAEDGAITISAARLLSNDPDGDRNVVGQVLDAQHGTVSLSSDGNIRFTPDLYYRGPAQFSYIANTPEGGAARATLYITVTPVNHAPLARNDGPFSTLENQAMTFDPTALLANDTDVDHDVLTITSVVGSADMQAVINFDGTITVTPKAFFHGATFFDYTISDASGATSTARVALDVVHHNTAPMAADDTIATYHGRPIGENSPIIVNTAELLANDTDHEGDSLAIVAVGNSFGGAARLLDNGTVLFTPWLNFNGSASFDYAVSDGSDGVGYATTTIVYQAVNQQPVAIDDSYKSTTDANLPRILRGTENAPLVIPIVELLKNDFDIEASTITFQSAGNANHGTLSLSGGPATALDANGDVAISPFSFLTYTPDAGYYGDALFSYVISDPSGAIGAGRVTVHFDPIAADAPPIANADSFTLFEDIPITIDIATLLANDSSADGSPLTFVGWAPDFFEGLRGAIRIDENGNLAFTPKHNWYGDTHFFYTIADGSGHQATAEVDLSIIGVPHDPTAANIDGLVTPLDMPLVVRVKDVVKQAYSVDAFDFNGDIIRPNPNLRFAGVDAVDHGTASVVTANGEQYIVVRFDPGYTGPVKITYRIVDQDGLQGTGFLRGTVSTETVSELDGTNDSNLVIRTLNGTDTVLTGNGNTTVYLGNGADTVTTGAGNDTIHAGTGDSTISTGAGDDVILGGAGADDIDGGTGFDTVDYSASHTGVNVDLSGRVGRIGDAQGDVYRNIESVIGSRFSDVLHADQLGDSLVGGDGNDTLIGGAGADTLRGGAGNDVLFGSAGADVMEGGEGDNTLDYSNSGAGVSIDLVAQTASGGDAEGDTLVGAQNVTGSRFADVLTGNGGDNILIGGQGDDSITGGAGNDLLVGGVGADMVAGGDGIDMVDYSGSAVGVSVDLAAGTATGGAATGDVLTGIENLVGSNYDDTLIGDASDNVLAGGAGVDVLDGAGGLNTADYSASASAVTVDLTTGTGSGGDAAGDTLVNIQRLVGSNYNDSLAGTSGDDTIQGGIGNDTLAGRAGSDTYLFGFDAGTDTVLEQGSAGDTDRIVLDAGIRPRDVSVTRAGNDMVLVFENQGMFLTDTLRVTDHFLGTSTGIEQVVFADGTIWDRAELDARSNVGVLNAADDVVYGVEEVTKVIDPATLFGNDVSGATAGLMLVSVQDAVNGSVAITPEGNIAFTGNPLYHGDAYFKYTVVDPFGRESTARVRVQLASTNHAPVAADHVGIQAYENTRIKLPFSYLLQGATDPENDALTVTSGAPLIDGNGSAFAPYHLNDHAFDGSNLAGVFGHDDVIGDYIALDFRLDYYGFAGFRYLISDGEGGTAWGNVEFFVNHVNQAPRFELDNTKELTIRLGKANELTVAQLLAGVIDPDGDAFHFVGVHDSDAGTLSYDAVAGTVSFTPQKLGKAGFQFDVADIYNATSTITVVLDVIPPFDPPIAYDDGGFSTLQNQVLVIDPAALLANDIDPNGDPLILAGIDRFALNGKISIRGDGMIVFAPRTNFNGAAGFHYQVTDVHGGVDSGWVSININAIDMGATLRDDIVADTQDQPITILAGEAFGNDIDPLGNVLFFHSATALGQLDTRYLSKDVEFSALTVRGKALPDWLHFDAATMTFNGIVPAGTTAPIEVEVKTFDPANGNSFVHYVTFDPTKGAEVAKLAAGWSVRDAAMSGYAIRGAFAESFDYALGGAGSNVAVTVTKADGTALPSWLVLDPVTLTLVGVPPAGTAPFATLVTFNYLDPASGATQILRRNVVVDPATIGNGVAINTHVAALALGAGTWTAHGLGNQPLPEWLDFDPTTRTLAMSGFAPAAGTQATKIDIDFTPNTAALPANTFAASHGGFTLEFTVAPGATLDPAINRILANSAYFAAQGEFGVDLARAVSVTATLANGNPLPSWLHFDAATLAFSGSPPPEFVGAVPVRLNVVGDGVVTPTFAILTDVVVDATYTVIPVDPNHPDFTAATTAEKVTVNTTINHFNGEIAVTYTTESEKGTVSVNAATDVVNVAPRLVPVRANADAYDLVQGHSITITLDDLLANDRDDNGDFFRVTSVSAPAHGTLVTTLGHFDLAPPANLVATATSTFSATLADGSALPAWMTLDTVSGVITVTPPIDIFATYAVRFTLTDGGASQTADASYAIDGNQGVSFVYTPDPAFRGNDGITYTLTDDKQAPVTANVALHVAPAVAAADDTASTFSDTPLLLAATTLLANDTSAEHQPLTITSVANASVGNVTFDGTNIVYTAPHYYEGEATFDYTVADGLGHLESATVTVAVTSSDHAPLAGAINLMGQEDSALTITTADILAHVTDADGEPIQLVSVSANPGTPARAMILPDGRIQFVPDAFRYGDMAFTYVVTDGFKTSTGALNIDFVKVNHPAYANTDGVYESQENAPVRLSLASLIANDVDPDGDAIAITAVYRGVNGTVVIDGTDAVFTPRAGYVGTASFNYTLTDANGAESEGLVEFLVLPNAYPPIAVSDSGFTMLQDTTLDIDPAQLTANDIDPDGIGVTFVGFVDGNVTKLDNGHYRVTPPANFSGPLVLTYAITNDSGVVVNSTVTIDVQHVEHAPIAVDDHLDMVEDQPLVLQAADLLANDSDLDNNAFGLTRIVTTNHVGVALDATTGAITVTPDAHTSGAASFDYEITDSTGRTGVATVNIDIAHVNHAPVVAATLPSVSSPEDAAWSFMIPAGTFADVDHDALTLAVTAADGSARPAWLAFDAATGMLSGTPPQDYNGTVDLLVTASDGQSAASTSLQLVVTPLNDAPIVVLAIANQSSPEDGPWSYAVPAGTFADVDGDGLTLLASLGDGSALPAWLSFDTVTRTFSGTPPANFNGDIALMVAASDGTASVVSHFMLTITPVNDAPAAANVAGLSVQSGALLVISAATLLANASDPDAGDTLTITSVGGPQNGTVTLAGAAITFTPAAGYAGPASFTYTVSDGHGGTATARADVAVLYNNVNGNDLANTITGTAGADSIFAGGGNDVVYGGAGDDRIDGGGGADTMYGGAGDDTYFIDSAMDLVTEYAGEGYDQVFSSISITTLTANVEALTLTGTALKGYGNDLDNVISGNAGANTIDGGLGGDTLIGGDGNDVYIVDNAGDVLIELPGQGIDQVQASVSTLLAENIENLYMTGTGAVTATGNAHANIIYANSGGDTIDGGLGADTLRGGIGNDTFIVDDAGDVVQESAAQGFDTILTSVTYTAASNIEKLMLTGTAAIDAYGNGLANVLVGNAAANTLDGLSGADTMSGGDGNDIYIVDNAGDVVSELAGQGSDLVRSLVSFTLGSNVENLTLTGVNAISGTGNELDNLIIGNVANNSLSGGAGSDTLNGGAGPDLLSGGSGADVFWFQSGFGKDTVADFIASGLGHDILQFDAGMFADAAAVLAASHQVGADTVITLDANNTVTLKGLAVSSLTAGVIRIP